MTADEPASAFAPIKSLFENGKVMLKSDATAIFTRRLGIPAGRAHHLVQRVSEAGLLPTTRGGERVHLSPLDLAHLLLAVVADRGLGSASQSVCEFAALQTTDGLVLADLLEAMIAGRANVSGLQSVVLQLDPPGVSVSTAAHHFRFGADHAGGAAKQIVIRGADLAAAILEMQGMPPDKADEAVAVGRLAAALT
jgi:hypothetical protein